MFTDDLKQQTAKKKKPYSWNYADHMVLLLMSDLF